MTSQFIFYVPARYLIKTLKCRSELKVCWVATSGLFKSIKIKNKTLPVLLISPGQLELCVVFTMFSNFTGGVCRLASGSLSSSYLHF